MCFVGVLCAVVAPWTALTRLSCSFFRDLSKLGVFSGVSCVFKHDNLFAWSSLDNDTVIIKKVVHFSPKFF